MTMDKNCLGDYASDDPAIRPFQETQVLMEATGGFIQRPQQQLPYAPQYGCQDLSQVHPPSGNITPMALPMQTIQSLVHPEEVSWNHVPHGHHYPPDSPWIPNYGMPPQDHRQDISSGHLMTLDGAPDPVSPCNDVLQADTHRPTARAQERNDTGTFTCRWEDCTYSGSFGRRSELRRHVETQHLAPSAYRCPERGCRKTFNRRDNLDEHLRRVHFWAV